MQVAQQGNPPADPPFYVTPLMSVLRVMTMNGEVTAANLRAQIRALAALATYWLGRAEAAQEKIDLYSQAVTAQIAVIAGNNTLANQTVLAALTAELQASQTAFNQALRNTDYYIDNGQAWLVIFNGMFP
jgi:phage gp37-like protein